jgi:hypothetical protein
MHEADVIMTLSLIRVEAESREEFNPKPIS